MFSKRYKFSDWSNSDIPQVAAGVYAIWKGEELVYCGMSGRQIEKNRHKAKFGLITRIQSHASGRLSGDQFCVYVANRLVIPSLQPEDLPRFASGELKLDGLTKSYIHENLEYQYLVVESSGEAYDIENKARSGETFGVSPLLNPIT
ncbi:TPA: hypothetical protein NKU97_004562 [Vibrio parahaemolyticus]|uniref:hypothetical protein n=1 Tax=Vibrio parahaemolyticus TaxID=670 RepID=UPI0011239166|nr:hypothetical protein [Vibrio parahaemolyticus]MDL1993505.1 hypothetical protein [Vibrio parahaemolyticus]TOG28245.1 hypothetical protein CGJ04_22970 [Vibrio parahaemolyticus]HCG7368251.1 hypothetical protein [Vibrio parahaemolyticus]HCG8581391.1 hypothetical protein [Vibrio parahaemolyticus]HCH3682823.1 hypothetical protein [Vibrio parahaemolyticus]